eukprot:TRINITY_DN67378_c0_g1_i1.p1 TRINITY_DN67378_c0_g1~~TRINITY_DN67378_c0_g1_i1.p1  ORF type:complete len:610 (-),score=118.46 TRINITY_DN67378_c0_g1_i1:264-1955(-)
MVEDLAADTCSEVPIDIVLDGNTSLTVDHIRFRLQGWVRSFSAEEFYDRYSPLFYAAISFMRPDILHTWRHRCVVGAASMGAFVLLTSGAKVQARILGRRGPLPATVPQDYVGGQSTLFESARAIEFALTQGTWLRADAGFAWPFCHMLAALAERLNMVDDFDAGVGAPEAANAARAKLATTGKEFFTLWNDWLSSSTWDVTLPLQKAAAAAMVAVATEESSHRLTCSALVAAAAAVTGGLEAVVSRIEACRRTARGGLRGLLAREWSAVWRGLDRLSAPRVVEIVARPPAIANCDRGCLSKASDPRFHMQLLPPYIHEDTLARMHLRFVADRTRASSSPHCNPTFREVAEDLLRQRRREDGPAVLVDVGAHLGDCCLWVAARWGAQRVQCHSFEMVSEVAEAARQSVNLNGFGDFVQVHSRRAAATEEHCLVERRGNYGGAHCIGSKCRSDTEADPTAAVTLDCFLRRRQRRRVDLVKIHVDGAEEEVLEGLLETLRSGRVAAMLVRSWVVAPAVFMEFVRKHRLPYSHAVYGSKSGFTVLLKQRNVTLPSMMTSSWIPSPM